jgi:hypothetical protein
MAWDFETEPELEEQLAWMRRFGNHAEIVFEGCRCRPIT